MDGETSRLGLWIPERLHASMKALAERRSREEQRRVELRTLYAEALSRLSDTLDGAADLDCRVDRRDRVRVSLVVSAELRCRIDGHCERLRVLGGEYAIEALRRYLAAEGAADGAHPQITDQRHAATD